ncbi:MAG TPA: glycosyltransferase family 4 protein, partial [Bacteroidales bacterium]|nr:glycosyltransferase family 4 protein [Bacteroidales bacterium]
MHVLIIPSWYKTDKEPFLGTFFEEQARMLQRKGIKVGILYPLHQKSFIKSFTSSFVSRTAFDDKGLYTLYSKTKPWLPTLMGNYLNKIGIVKYAYSSFLAYCKINGTPDIIHSHSIYWGGVVAHYISQKKTIPFVHTEHLSSLIYTDEYDKKPLKNYLKTVFANSKRNIFVSHAFEQAMIDKYQVKNSITIHNVVNPIFFDNKEIKNNVFSEFYIVNIGRLIKMKNQKTLIQAVNLLYNILKIKIKLTIIGEGILESQLIEESQIINKNVTIEFISKANRNQIAKYIQRSHVLASSSVFETFGLTLAEAIACGVPVVAYKTMGIDEIMTKENGIIVSENTPFAFAEALSKIYYNFAKYDSRKISNDCYSQFSEDVISKKIIDLYQEIL